MISGHRHRRLAAHDQRPRPAIATCGCQDLSSVGCQPGPDRFRGCFLMAAVGNALHECVARLLCSSRSGRSGSAVVADDDVPHMAPARSRPGAGGRRRLGRHARARGDHIEIVADHVGEHEHEQVPGGAGLRQAASLHEAQLPAGGIERGDVGPRLGEPPRDGDLLVERNTILRRGQERRAAAGDHRDRQITGPKLRDRRHDLAGRLHDGGRRQVGFRGTGLADLDGREATAASSRHAHEPRHAMPCETLGPEQLFHRRRHARCRLACPHHHDPIDLVEPQRRIERLPVMAQLPPIPFQRQPRSHQTLRLHGTHGGRPDGLGVVTHGGVAHSARGC